MSYYKKRIEYNNNWPESVIEFSAQTGFQNLMSAKGISQILKPIRLPEIPDYEFQRLLSFKIDIYEQLPSRPDIAFDLAWRTFEAYSSHFSVHYSWSTTKTHKILQKVCEDILMNQFSSNPNLKVAVERVLNFIPLQAAEFVVKRLFETASGSIKSQQTKIRERVEDALGVDLVANIEAKYSPITPGLQRKAGMLLQLIMSGQQVVISGNNFTLSLEDRLKFLINGILYTYRNERFHGDSFSPFKSSKTSIKTYAHSYYCLISTYFFLAQLIYNHYPARFDINMIVMKLEENSTRYDLVFGEYKKE